jgi:hypothetical protein
MGRAFTAPLAAPHRHRPFISGMSYRLKANIAQWNTVSLHLDKYVIIMMGSGSTYTVSEEAR